MKGNYTKEDFNKLTKVEMHRLWFKQAMTEKQIAKLYNVSRKEVHDKRKIEFGLNFINSAILYLTNTKYK